MVKPNPLLIRRFRASRHLTFVGIGLLGIILFAASAAVWDRREEAISRSQQEITQLGILLAEQTARSVQAIDLVLQETTALARAAGANTPEQFEDLMGTEAVHRFLAERLKLVPQADTVALVSAEGRLVNGSRGWPVPAVDVSDRDYYEHLRQHDAVGIYISTPLSAGLAAPGRFSSRDASMGLRAICWVWW